MSNENWIDYDALKGSDFKDSAYSPRFIEIQSKPEFKIGFHKAVSFAKSGLRILGCFGGLYNFNLFLIAFGLAEILGIVEEFKEKN